MKRIMLNQDSIQMELFRMYKDGFVQYSTLLVSATVGFFTPLAILVNPNIPILVKSSLFVVSLIFAIVSGYSLSRLAGTFVLMHKNMPPRMRLQYMKDVVGSDYLALGSCESVINTLSKKKVQLVILIMPAVIYLILVLPLFLPF
jgi:hypothetical protein